MLSRLFHECDLAAQIETEASSTRLRDMNLRTPFLQPAAKQDQAAFQVVFEIGQMKCLIET